LTERRELQDLDAVVHCTCRWFIRFQDKYRKDPDFLARDKERL